MAPASQLADAPAQPGQAKDAVQAVAPAVKGSRQELAAQADAQHNHNALLIQAAAAYLTAKHVVAIQVPAAVVTVLLSQEQQTYVRILLSLPQ